MLLLWFTTSLVLPNRTVFVLKEAVNSNGTQWGGDANICSWYLKVCILSECVVKAVVQISVKGYSMTEA